MRDRFDNAVSTQSARALEHYVEGVDHLFTMHVAVDDSIDAALEADPEFALAHCVKARALLLSGATKEAVRVADRAVELAQTASAREVAHAEIVALATRGDNAAALPRVLAHAEEYPRDAMPLSFALGVYGLLGFGGFADHHERQRDLLLSLQDHWGVDWWFDSWLGWSYVETDQTELGVPLLDRSLEARPVNATTAHARAHGFYEDGALDEGAAFIDDWLPCYDPQEPLHCHLAWHLALFHLRASRWQEAHDTYMRYVRPAASRALPMFTMIDCAAFMWRARLAGYDCDAEELAEVSSFTLEHFERPGIPFVDLHRYLVTALTGIELEQREESDGLAAETSAELIAALACYHEGNKNGAAERLRAIGARADAIGGSHAQRDLIVGTYLDALAAGGEPLRSDDPFAVRARTLGFEGE